MGTLEINTGLPRECGEPQYSLITYLRFIYNITGRVTRKVPSFVKTTYADKTPEVNGGARI